MPTKITSNPETVKRYVLTSCKGNREFDGTLADAIGTARIMERDLQPAYGVAVELDGETLAEVHSGKVEREDEQAAPTAAEQVAREMGEDGSRSTAPDGRSLQQVCRAHGAEVWRRASGDRRYEFRDGSAIVVLSGAWDIKHDDCDCGWCWPETDAESLCTSSQYSQREWMLTSDTLDTEDAEHDAERAE